MAFQSWTQVSTCVGAWNSAFLSGCQRCFRPPGELSLGLVSFPISKWGIRTPFMLWDDSRLTFASVKGNQAWSRVDGEIRGFQIVTRLPCSPPVSHRYQPPLEVRRGCQHSFPGEAGQSTLISTWGGENGALLDLWWESQCTSRVRMGIWGNFWSFLKRVEYPFKF